MFESLIFVLFLSLLSVVGSAINFRMRLQVAENALRVEQSEKNSEQSLTTQQMEFFNLQLKVILSPQMNHW